MLGPLALAQAQRPTRKVKNAPPPPTQWPSIPPVDPGTAWAQALKQLLTNHAARHPELLFERRGSKLVQRRLGTYGADAAMRYRDTLTDVQTALGRFDLNGIERVAGAQQRALAAWVEAELIQLDAQTLATSDPASYVEHALHTLRAAQEAVWIAPDERLKNLGSLVNELPAYFRDARISLMAPTPQWIDLALHDLDDLEALLGELEKVLPKNATKSEIVRPRAAPTTAEARTPTPSTAARKSASAPAAKASALALEAGKTRAKGPAKALDSSASKNPKNTKALDVAAAKPRPAPPPEPVDPRAALDEFRAWLLELRPSAGGQPPRLNDDEWTRLVQLATGTELSAGELKARCLRDLAHIDRDASPQPLRRRRALDPEEATARSSNAAAHAFLFAQEARILKVRLAPQELEFGLEESERTGCESVRLTSGATEHVQALLQLPSHAWSVERATTRDAGLETRALLALGVRKGLAGEGLLTRTLRDEKNPLVALLANRSLREGFGLYALDWVARVDWVDNPLRKDAELMREFELQRGYEACRLLAALELHAENVSVDEACLSFVRRTGVDSDTALAEILAAERDPLRGIGWLGHEELRALEDKLSALTDPKRGLALTLMLVRRHPELRPSDLAASIGKGKHRPR